jgi:hypothetical protein
MIRCLLWAWTPIFFIKISHILHSSCHRWPVNTISSIFDVTNLTRPVLQSPHRSLLLHPAEGIPDLGWLTKRSGSFFIACDWCPPQRPGQIQDSPPSRAVAPKQPSPVSAVPACAASQKFEIISASHPSDHAHQRKLAAIPKYHTTVFLCMETYDLLFSQRRNQLR